MIDKTDRVIWTVVPYIVGAIAMSVGAGEQHARFNGWYTLAVFSLVACVFAYRTVLSAPEEGPRKKYQHHAEHV